jgi:hypothetical protein
MGAIKWGEALGPCRIFLKETLEEMNEVEELLKRMQAKERPRLEAEFKAREQAKEVSN